MEENLPQWDLKDLYNGINDSLIVEDKTTITTKTADFVNKFKKPFSNQQINSYLLLSAIKEYEKIQVLLNKLLSYSYLLYATDVTNKEIAIFLEKNKEFVQKIASELVFFDLSINLISKEDLEIYLNEEKNLQFYKSFLLQLRKLKPYQLPELAEQILIAKQNVARSSWVRLYDETLASLQFNDPVNKGEKVSLSTILNLQLSNNNKLREKAATSLKEGLRTKEELIVTIINNIASDHSINNKIRKFPTPYSSMNLHNLIEDSIMENLVQAVTSSYKAISQRYYKLKAKILQVDKLNYWDRNAPLFEVENKFTFKEAKDIILTSFNKFNKEFARIAEMFFQNNWIDARLLPNKMSGAFAHPTVVISHPYILVNFHSKYIDVTTLAHELGHGIHQYLARENGELQSGTPLVLAETASIFGEQLVFDYLKDTITDNNMKKYLLSNKIESIINSVHRQIAFHMFELHLHEMRAQQELNAKQIKEIFIKTQTDCLGEGVNLNKEDGIFWCYVSHFFHVPFYVYAYAFGDCLVRSLYANYKDGSPHFIEYYVNLLKSGGTLLPQTAIEQFGFDISKQDFWNYGLSKTIKLIDDLESLVE